MYVCMYIHRELQSKNLELKNSLLQIYNNYKELIDRENKQAHQKSKDNNSISTHVDIPSAHMFLQRESMLADNCKDLKRLKEELELITQQSHANNSMQTPMHVNAEINNDPISVDKLNKHIDQMIMNTKVKSPHEKLIAKQSFSNNEAFTILKHEVHRMKKKCASLESSVS